MSTRQKKGNQWAPWAWSYHFVSNTVKCPVVTSSLDTSGVTVGHFGRAPGRKCDPAALGLCVALCLPLGTLCVTARTSVTAPIQLEITFVVLFFVSIVCGHFCLNKSTALQLTFLQMLFGNCDRPVQGVFHAVSSSLWVTVAAGAQSCLKASGYNISCALFTFNHIYLKCDVFICSNK